MIVELIYFALINDEFLFEMCNYNLPDLPLFSILSQYFILDIATKYIIFYRNLRSKYKMYISYAASINKKMIILQIF